tara:strand:+ start:2452 stop:3114 length:663 start_codon:yes stop_codon:yes gene_type:complete
MSEKVETMNAAQPGLVLRNVSVLLHGTPLLTVSLSVAPGEIVTIAGASGAGKSTLLSYLCGSLGGGFVGAGDVLVNGVVVNGQPPWKRNIGILFQDDLLFPHLSVAGNLNFAIRPDVRAKAERHDRIAAALEAAGLTGFEKRDPATLSGGQRARVSVMRVLLSEPQVLLMDEPFSKLDAETRGQFRDFVFTQIRERQIPTLMVTHDSEDADAAGGRIIRL